ncbi:bifunctional aspartate kinase/homoserine dehydrogenase I [Legionella sp. W05-934-2]|jgi:aspartokinase/homoserine dehydrogenase 1|uniref:bifunctional aspartate kinase/homoserine dehydrogenase I n=1 Tax=Legionella sp. W05-934-2 TaxID=1198649 RepID=UPI003462D006
MRINQVYKIGGRCLQDKAGFDRIKEINLEQSLLVVSAAGGTTNALKKALALAKSGEAYEPILVELEMFHKQLAADLGINTGVYTSLFNESMNDLKAVLTSIELLGRYAKLQADWVLGQGELWSSRLVAEMLGKKSVWLNSAKIITIHRLDGVTQVNWTQTETNLTKQMPKEAFDTVIAPGYIAQEQDGLFTLLGDNGSDFSAAIYAKVLKAKSLTKLTHVDGIYSADPTRVQSAFVLPYVSYQEVAELAYFGAEILHPQTVQPAISAKIPIIIKNIHKLSEPGTRIDERQRPSMYIVKGLTSMENVNLITIEGTGILGVCGMSARIFGLLSHHGISVIFISQASSEYSISLVVSDVHGQLAQSLIEEELVVERQEGIIAGIILKQDCSVVAAVGDGMCGHPGVAAQFFSNLAKAQVNILAIAQSASERNISVIINENDTTRSLRALHGGFYLSDRAISVGLIGPGGVGQVLLGQLEDEIENLRSQFRIDFRLRGIINSQEMVLSDKQVTLKDWEQAKSKRKADLRAFIHHIASEEIPHAVIIDCSASPIVAQAYIDMIDMGCHIITPNKQANAAPMAQFITLKSKLAERRRFHLYETTVCAGLPVIKTIRDLLDTGDQIKRIEGVVSGTLSYIFNQCAQGKSFAESVLSAYDLGYTEPDPRDDLNGLDVARKFVCLAREIGLETELNEVSLLNLVPKPLREVTKDEFLQQLPHYQDEINQYLKNLLEGQASIAYVGIIEDEQVSVSLKAYPANHPFANIHGTDNILQIQSRRYDKQPLIIQGPGAGLDVTAAGIFADFLKLVSYL